MRILVRMEWNEYQQMFLMKIFNIMKASWEFIYDFKGCENIKKIFDGKLRTDVKTYFTIEIKEYKFKEGSELNERESLSELRASTDGPVGSPGHDSGGDAQSDPGN